MHQVESLLLSRLATIGENCDAFFPRATDFTGLYIDYVQGFRGAGLRLLRNEQHFYKAAYRGLGELVHLLTVAPLVAAWVLSRARLGRSAFFGVKAARTRGTGVDRKPISDNCREVGNTIGIPWPLDKPGTTRPLAVSFLFRLSVESSQQSDEVS